MMAKETVSLTILSNYGEQAGHWDINWEGVATDCSPGMTGSAAALQTTLS